MDITQNFALANAFARFLTSLGARRRRHQLTATLFFLIMSEEDSAKDETPVSMLRDPLERKEKDGEDDTEVSQTRTSDDPDIDLDRFLVAQSGDDGTVSFDKAFREICAGHKRSCWIWYVFPQYLERQSRRCKKFQIRSSCEAIAYLRHRQLGLRYLKICQAAATILDVRKMKTRSSLTRHLCGSAVDEKKMYQSVSLFYLTLRFVTDRDAVRSDVFRRFVDDMMIAIVSILRGMYRDGGSYLRALDEHGVDRVVKNGVVNGESDLDRSTLRKFHAQERDLSAWCNRNGL